MPQNNSFGYYRDTIKSNRILGREEERLLIAEAKRGSVAARNRLFMSNLGFVIKMSRAFMVRNTRCRLSIEDMVTKGFEAFCHAIEKFDTGRDEKLITYASGWLTCYFQRLVEEESGVSRRCASQVSFVSIDVPVGQDDGCCLGDLMEKDYGAPAGDMFRRELKERIERVMSENLSRRQATVVARRLGLFGMEERSCVDIGKSMGCSKAYVSELYRKALKVLSSDENVEWFRDYMAA